jgi:hypothetical protein
VTEGLLECWEAAKGEEFRQVGVASENGEHPGEVGGRRDQHAQSLADRFPRGRTPEVVLASACARGLMDDLEPAPRAPKLDEWPLADVGLVNRDRLAGLQACYGNPRRMRGFYVAL